MDEKGGEGKITDFGDKMDMNKNAKNPFGKVAGGSNMEFDSNKGETVRFPQEVTDFCQTLNKFIALRVFSMSEVMHNLTKAEPFLKMIGFDSYDVDELKMSFFKGKLKDLREVYSGYKISDLETDLKNCHQDVIVSNHITKIGERNNLKIDEDTSSINFKQTATPDVLAKFEDFKREYERYVNISGSDAFLALKVQGQGSHFVEGGHMGGGLF